MSNELIQKLEAKVDAAIEYIELLKMQIEELESTNKNLDIENTKLHDNKANWETNINSLLNKLSTIEDNEDSTKNEFETNAETSNEMA